MQTPSSSSPSLLPTHRPPPRFDVAVVRDRYSYVAHDAGANGGESLETHVAKPSSYRRNGSHHFWSNMRTERWTLAIHGNMYRFVKLPL
jgi:hypothetical protein